MPRNSSRRPTGNSNPVESRGETQTQTRPLPPLPGSRPTVSAQIPPLPASSSSYSGPSGHLASAFPPSLQAHLMSSANRDGQASSSSTDPGTQRRPTLPVLPPLPFPSSDSASAQSPAGASFPALPALPQTAFSSAGGSQSVPPSSSSSLPASLQRAAIRLRPQHGGASSSTSGVGASQQPARMSQEQMREFMQSIASAGENRTPAQGAFQQGITQRAIAGLTSALHEFEQPGERYNFRPISHILFEIYNAVSILHMDMDHRQGFLMDQVEEKRAFITRQFTDGKFSGTGQFNMARWVDAQGRDVLSIFLAKFYLNQEFNVQTYESIPANLYNDARHKEDGRTINIHSFMEIFVDQQRRRILRPHLLELFNEIEQNCNGERKFNLCVIQHLMCFGVQLHYNLTLLKPYTLKVELEKLQTPSVTLLNWNFQNHLAYSFLVTQFALHFMRNGCKKQQRQSPAKTFNQF